MNRTIMINKLLERFSEFAIGQTIYFHTKRTTNIDDTTDEELKEIYLLFFPLQPSVSEQLFDAKNNEILKRFRSNVLTIATRVGVKEANCWNKFNNWMLNSSKYKKKLNDHTLEELKALELQLRATEVNYNRSALKVGTKAWHHKHNLNPPSEN